MNYREQIHEEQQDPDKESEEDEFVQKIPLPIKYAAELDRIKKSPLYRKLQSKNDLNYQKSQSKTFEYHYSEEKQFELGAGSYGKVYVCYYEDKIRNKIFKLALKIIKIPNRFADVRKIEEIVAFTRQEVKSMLQLRDNPNILKIEDYVGDTKNNRIYIVLQFCNDKDLGSFFHKLRNDRNKPLKEEQIIYYFKQILNAFKDLYDLNIIHRDIKPENILVQDKVLKIADFGLSRQIFQKNEEFHEEHYGTRVTSSPQIRFREPYTSMCDIYSLGVTFYWMIFQRYPFHQLSTRQDLLKNDINFEKEDKTKVSPEIIELITKMMAFSESDRIQWTELFNHPLFRDNNLKEYSRPMRETIGRLLQSEHSNSLFLDRAIPEELYVYIMDELQKFEITESNYDKNIQNDPIFSMFVPIFFEVINIKFKVHFLKELSRELYEFQITDKNKNKIQISILKDLVRYGLENYILYILKNIKSQLTLTNTCFILDPKQVKMVRDEAYYDRFVHDFTTEIDTYEKSSKKPKLSLEEKEILKKRCDQYQISQQFQLILMKAPILNERDIFLELKKAMVEIIYMIKEQVKLYQDKESGLAEVERKRYRSLILLIHHFYMFILHKKIFHEKYDPSLDYDIQKFNRREKYLNEKDFSRLSEGVIQILDRFEN